MRTKVKIAAAETVLLRLLDGLEQELLEATDEEVLEAARDLGLDPRMKGSAVFAGLTYPARPQLEDFFDLEQLKRVLLEKQAREEQPTQQRRDSQRRVAISPPTKDPRKQ